MKKSKLKITFLSLIFAFATFVPVVSTGNFCAIAKTNNYNVNYKKEFTSFTIEKADEINTTAEASAGTNIKPTLSESSFTYNGKEQTVTVIDYDSTKMTEFGTKSATDVGVYELTYTIIDTSNPFSDGTTTCTLTWEIVKANDNAITNLQIDDWVYGENANTPTATSTYGNITYTYEGVNGTSYASSASAPTKAGTYKVIASVSETENYNGATAEKEFAITKKTKILPTLDSVPYNGTTQIAEVEETDEYIVVTNNGGVNAGKYNVTIKMSDELFANYKWATTDSQEVTILFEITKATDNIITEIVFEDFVYGTDPTPATVKAKYGAGNVRFEIDDEETDFSDLVLEAGSHTLVATIAGTSNYNEATLTKEFKVNKIVVKQSDLPTISGSYVYNGKEQTVSLVGEKEYLTISGDKSGINAKEYTLTISLTDSTNYEFDTNVVTTLVWTIAKGVNEFTTPLSMSGWTYGEAVKTPTAVSKWGTVIFTYTTRAGEVVSVDALSTANAGEYIVTATVVADGDNYDEISESVNFTINKAKVRKPTEDSSTFTYNKTEQTYTLTTNSAYTIKNNTRTNAGSQIVTVSLVDTTNYEWENGSIDDVTYTFTINKAKLIAPTVTTGTFTYDGTVKNLELNGINETTMSITNNSSTKAGKYTAVVALLDTDNYEWADDFDGNISWQINKATKALPELGSVPYNGTTQIAEVEETDEYIVVANNGGVNAGKYDVTIKMTDELFANYKWATTDAQEVTVTFEITKATDNAITDLQINGWIYGENANTPTATSTYGNITYTYEGVNGTSYASSASAPTMAGTYKVIASVSETENYNSATAEKEFAITKAKLTAPTIKTGSFTYDGTVKTLELTGLDETKMSITENTSTNAGSYTAKVSLNDTDNYEWTDGFDGNLDWNITKIQIEAPQEDLTTFTYNKTEQTYTLTTNSAYTITNNKRTNAGGQTVTISLVDKTNYEWANGSTDDITYTFTIGKAVIEVIPTVRGSYTYTGSVITLEPNGFDDEIMSISGNCATVVGNYNAIITPNENYMWAEAFDGNISWSITKASNKFNSLVITEWSLDDEPNAPRYSVDFGVPTFKYIGIKGTTYESDEAPTEVGKYKLIATVVATDNYDGATAETIFSVAGASNEITNLSITGWVYGKYDETINKPNATALHGDIKYYYVLRGETSYTEENLEVPTNAGNYTVIAVVEGTSEYAGATSSFDFTIEQAEVLESYKPTISGEYVYTGNEQTVVVSGKADYMTLTGEVSGANAKTYTIVITLDSNYKWADGFDGTLTWTISKVTNNEISDLTITGWKYGENANLPTATARFGEITYTYEGINGTSYERSLVSPTKVGNYKVTASVADSTNYNSCTATFEFAISKGNVVVNETPQSKTEGEDGAFNVDVPENSGVLIYYAPTGTQNWSTTVPTTVGVYDIKVVVESTNNNYNEFEKIVTAGFKVTAKIVPAPAEPEKQEGLNSYQIGVLITTEAIGFIAVALLIAICIHHKNEKRAEEFLDEQEDENIDD